MCHYRGADDDSRTGAATLGKQLGLVGLVVDWLGSFEQINLRHHIVLALANPDPG